MLILASRAQLDTLPGKVLCGPVRQNDAAFTVRDELPHRAMKTDPYLVNGFHEGLRVLVRNDSGGIPYGASADHVEDDTLADEKQVTFNLVVEFVRNVHTADVVRAWFSPLATDLACLNDFWDELQNSLGNSCAIQTSLHDMF
jgi:hypothetical protein